MIETGANPQAAILMAEMKKNAGKSVSLGLADAVDKLTAAQTGGGIEKAAREGYYSSVRSMVSSQNRREQ